MTAVRRLLAATDLSARARIAVARAARIAAEQGAALELLHVVRRDSLDALRGLVDDEPRARGGQLVESARAELERMAGTLAREHGVTAGVRVAVGAPHASIVEEAARFRSDLTVLGAHGENVLLDLFPGTTAQRIVREAPGPVLVVRHEPDGGYKSVLVPVDFSGESRLAFEWARRLAPRAAICVLHAYDVPFEGRMRLAGVTEDALRGYRERARRQAEANVGDFLCAVEGSEGGCLRIVRRGYPPALIMETVREVQADLVAVGGSGRSGVPRWLMGSVSNHVLMEAPCDVLVIRRVATGAPADRGT